MSVKSFCKSENGFNILLYSVLAIVNMVAIFEFNFLYWDGSIDFSDLKHSVCKVENTTYITSIHLNGACGKEVCTYYDGIVEWKMINYNYTLNQSWYGSFIPPIGTLKECWYFGYIMFANPDDGSNINYLVMVTAGNFVMGISLIVWIILLIKSTRQYFMDKNDAIRINMQNRPNNNIVNITKIVQEIITETKLETTTNNNVINIPGGHVITN